MEPLIRKCICGGVSLLTAFVVEAGVGLVPDYANITLPPNIAPLNFDVQNGSTQTEVILLADTGASYSSRGAEVRIPLVDWKRLLDKASSYTITIKEEQATVFCATNHIAQETIDSTLVYRLIPPSYENYAEVGIYQRDLTSFAEYPLYTNYQSSPKQCVNCHSFCMGNPDQFLFHVRAEEAGTVIFRDGADAGIKRTFKGGPFFTNGVYPAWHPSGQFIAFSVNETMQGFYTANLDKVEVIDARSDMLVYDVANDSVLPVETTPEIFDCFPSWSPDGKQLYSVAATPNYIPPYEGEKKAREQMAIEAYTNLCYNLIVRDFDAKARTFSQARMVLNAASQQQSITLPRVSPDGRWLVFTLGPQGVFHIWHKSANLWLLDLKTSHFRPITEINSDDVESYHTFSSNGAWMVFSTRRDDGAYTRPYFTHFDSATGQFTKPFKLPVISPKADLHRMVSYNVPELVKGKITRTPKQIRKVVQQQTIPAKQKE